MTRRLVPMAGSQRALTDMAGERVAEMLSWRAGDHLDFAIVVWPRRGEGKATAYVSTAGDAALAVKLSALIAEHHKPDDTTTT